MIENIQTICVNTAYSCAAGVGAAVDAGLKLFTWESAPIDFGAGDVR